MATKTPLERVAFSPGEFAELFGKSQTWGYRQIYSGKVKAITEHGRILIPAAEVDAILKTAGIYDGLKPKEVKTKADIQTLTPRLKNAWQRFLITHKHPSAQSRDSANTEQKTNWPTAPAARAAVLARLTRKTKRGEVGS